MSIGDACYLCLSQFRSLWIVSHSSYILWFYREEVDTIKYIHPNVLQAPLLRAPDAVAELVERELRVWETGSLVPGRVKPMTYNIYIYHFLAWCSALQG